MGCNNHKYSDTCGCSPFATCVTVQQEFPEISSLDGENCSDLDTVIEDLYELIGKSYVDISDYEKGCLDYSPTLDADITPIQVLNKLTSEICTLKTTVSDIDSVDISELDLSCLGNTDTCGEPLNITDLKGLLQELVNRICNLEKS